MLSPPHANGDRRLGNYGKRCGFNSLYSACVVEHGDDVVDILANELAHECDTSSFLRLDHVAACVLDRLGAPVADSVVNGPQHGGNMSIGRRSYGIWRRLLRLETACRTYTPSQAKILRASERRKLHAIKPQIIYHHTCSLRTVYSTRDCPDLTILIVDVAIRMRYRAVCLDCLVSWYRSCYHLEEHKSGNIFKKELPPRSNIFRGGWYDTSWRYCSQKLPTSRHW